jgi:hypothetical protein
MIFGQIRNKINVYTILSRLVSLLIGGIDVYVVCSWYPGLYNSFHASEGGSTGAYYILFILIQLILVALPLLCIWLGKYFADMGWGDQRWRIPHWDRQMSLFPCSVSLLRLSAWILLLVPIFIFMLSK